MSQELVHLSWNDFKTTAVQSFQNLQKDPHFTDMTLACDNGQQVLAHKIVLSSCSTLFRNLLVQNPHQHPLIYLSGVGIENLKNVIKFIYSGEVEVEHDHLKQFLEVGNELAIEGLKRKGTADENVRMIQNTTTDKVLPKEKQLLIVGKNIKKEPEHDISPHDDEDDDDDEDPFEETDIIVENPDENIK